MIALEGRNEARHDYKTEVNQQHHSYFSRSFFYGRIYKLFAIKILITSAIELKRRRHAYSEFTLPSRMRVNVNPNIHLPTSQTYAIIERLFSLPFMANLWVHAWWFSTGLVSIHQFSGSHEKMNLLAIIFFTFVSYSPTKTHKNDNRHCLEAHVEYVPYIKFQHIFQRLYLYVRGFYVTALVVATWNSSFECWQLFRGMEQSYPNIILWPTKKTTSPET